MTVATPAAMKYRKTGTSVRDGLAELRIGRLASG
jgi:hypothetical protein